MSSFEEPVNSWTAFTEQPGWSLDIHNVRVHFEEFCGAFSAPDTEDGPFLIRCLSVLRPCTCFLSELCVTFCRSLP
jgi:hypothetical protein